MNVTPAILSACYAHLRGLRPFSRWRLPEPEEVHFALHSGEDHATYQVTEDGSHIIKLNSLTHTTHSQIMMSVAHEMIHMRQELAGRLPFKNDGHNAEFRRLAWKVCKEFGWDAQVF